LGNLNNLGAIVLSETTRQNFFSFDVSLIPSGIYPFVISIESNKNGVFGKFLIQH